MPDFSDTLMDHFQSPRNQGRLDSPDCFGFAGVSGQGRSIELSLRLASNHVERMQFTCNGCGVTVAVCSVLTELVEGKSKAECAALQATDIITALDGIPPHKQDCAHFAIVALRNALEDWPDAETESVSSNKMAL